MENIELKKEIIKVITETNLIKYKYDILVDYIKKNSKQVYTDSEQLLQFLKIIEQEETNDEQTKEKQENE